MDTTDQLSRHHQPHFTERKVVTDPTRAADHSGNAKTLPFRSIGRTAPTASEECEVLASAAAILERLPMKTESSRVVERALVILMRSELARRRLDPVQAANDGEGRAA